MFTNTGAYFLEYIYFFWSNLDNFTEKNIGEIFHNQIINTLDLQAFWIISLLLGCSMPNLHMSLCSFSENTNQTLLNLVLDLCYKFLERTFPGNINPIIMCRALEEVHSFIQQSVLRQVQSLFKSEISTQCDLELPPSNEGILSFP